MFSNVGTQQYKWLVIQYAYKIIRILIHLKRQTVYIQMIHLRPEELRQIFGRHINAMVVMPMVLDTRESQGPA